MDIKPFSFNQPLRKILFVSDNINTSDILKQRVGQLCQCFFKDPVEIFTVSSLSFAIFKKAGDPVFMDKLPIYSIIHVVQQLNSIVYEVLTRLDLKQLISFSKQDIYQQFYHQNKSFDSKVLENFERMRQQYIQRMFTNITDRLFQQIFVATQSPIPLETLSLFSVVKAETSNFYRILLAQQPKEMLLTLKQFQPRFLLSGTGYFVYNKTVFSDPFMLDLVYSYLNINFDDLLSENDFENLLTSKIGYRTIYDTDSVANFSEVQLNTFISNQTQQGNNMIEQSQTESSRSENLLECKLLTNFTSYILKNFLIKCNTSLQLQNFIKNFEKVMKNYNGSYGYENIVMNQIENGCLMLLKKPFCIEISSILGFALCSLLRNNNCTIYVFQPNVSSLVDFEQMLSSTFQTANLLVQSLDLCDQQQKYELVISTYVAKCFASVDRYFYANSLLLVKGELDSKQQSLLSSFAQTQLFYDGSTTIALLRNINQNSSLVLLSLKQFLSSLAHYNYYNFERNLIRAFCLIDFNVLGQIILPFLNFSSKAKINFDQFDKIIEKTRDNERRSSNQFITSNKLTIQQSKVVQSKQQKSLSKYVKEPVGDPEFDLFPIDFEPTLSNQFQHFLFHGSKQNMQSFAAFLEQFQQIESSAFELTTMSLDECFLFVQTRKPVSPLSYQWFLFTSSASICNLVFYELRNIKNKHNLLHFDMTELYEHVRCDNSVKEFPLLLTYHIEQFMQKAFKEVETPPTALVLYSNNLNDNLIKQISQIIHCATHQFHNHFIVMSKIEWTDTKKIKFGEILQVLGDFNSRAISRYYLAMIQTVMTKPIFLELLSKFVPNLPTNCNACCSIFQCGDKKPDLTIEQLQASEQQYKSNSIVSPVEAPVPRTKQGNCSIGIFDKKGMLVNMKEPQVTYLPHKQEVKRLVPVQVYEHDDNSIISQFNCRTIESLEVLYKQQRDEINYLRSCIHTTDLYPQRGLGSIPRLSSMEGNGKYYTSDIDKRIDLFINAESYMQEEIQKFKNDLNNDDCLNRFLPPYLVQEFQSKHWQKALKEDDDSGMQFDDYEESSELSSFSSDTDEMSDRY